MISDRLVFKTGWSCNHKERSELLDLMNSIKEVTLTNETFDMFDVLYYIKPDQEKIFLVAMVDEKMIGYVYGTLESAGYACLYYLAVRQEARRNGIGKLLVQEFLKEVEKKWDVKYVYTLSTNQNMTNFIKWIGFYEGEKVTYLKFNLVKSKIVK